MATLTWHASKHKIHKLHQRYNVHTLKMINQLGMYLWWSYYLVFTHMSDESCLSWLKSFMLVVFIWCLLGGNELPSLLILHTLGLTLFQTGVHRQAKDGVNCHRKTYPPLASHQGWWWHTWFPHCTFWWHWHFQQSLKTMVRNNQSTHQLILVWLLFFFSLLSVLIH